MDTLTEADSVSKSSALFFLEIYLVSTLGTLPTVSNNHSNASKKVVLPSPLAPIMSVNPSPISMELEP